MLTPKIQAISRHHHRQRRLGFSCILNKGSEEGMLMMTLLRRGNNEMREDLEDESNIWTASGVLSYGDTILIYWFSLLSVSPPVSVCVSMSVCLCANWKEDIWLVVISSSYAITHVFPTSKKKEQSQSRSDSSSYIWLANTDRGAPVGEKSVVTTTTTDGAKGKSYKNLLLLLLLLER